MDIRKIKKLIELVEESGIAELEISEGEESVRIQPFPGEYWLPHDAASLCCTDATSTRFSRCSSPRSD